VQRETDIGQNTNHIIFAPCWDSVILAELASSIWLNRGAMYLCLANDIVHYLDWFTNNNSLVGKHPVGKHPAGKQPADKIPADSLTVDRLTVDSQLEAPLMQEHFQIH